MMIPKNQRCQERKLSYPKPWTDTGTTQSCSNLDLRRILHLPDNQLRVDIDTGWLGGGEDAGAKFPRGPEM